MGGCRCCSWAGEYDFRSVQVIDLEFNSDCGWVVLMVGNKITDVKIVCRENIPVAAIDL